MNPIPFILAIAINATLNEKSTHKIIQSTSLSNTALWKEVGVGAFRVSPSVFKFVKEVKKRIEEVGSISIPLKPEAYKLLSTEIKRIVNTSVSQGLV